MSDVAEFVRVKNTNTGAIASLPKSALRFLPDWQPAPGPVPQKPKPKKSLTKAVSTASNEKE